MPAQEISTRPGPGRLSLSRKAMTRRTALSLSRDIKIDEWRRIGQEIFLISDASGWWLGDWLIFGQQRYPERYKQAIADTGLDYQTLRNYAWITRRFDVSRRRDGLSIQHHAEVAALPEAEQDLWLDRAEHQHWSRNELRNRLRAARNDEDVTRPGTSVQVRMKISAEQKQRWEAAAQLFETSLSDWMSKVLDNVALATVTTDEAVQAITPDLAISGP